MSFYSNKLGIVVVGRNEGNRLLRSLTSIVNEGCPIVYVDSGSTDSSCEAAAALGAEVVALDSTSPFTAARARNAGFERLCSLHPQVEFVQFLDGDCELAPGWLQAALETMTSREDIVAVCGWGKEMYPEKSIYNRICSVEWRIAEVGETQHFGGIVMIRADAFLKVQGFDSTVVAAEDDELGVRLRQAGGKFLRLGQYSYIHDADMHSFWQWWKRAKRCGYAYAQVSWLHGAPPERKFVREIRRVVLWGMVVPFLALVLAPFTHGLSLLVFLRYPLTAIKVSRSTHQKGFSWQESILWGLSCGFSAFPATLGVISFYSDRLQKKKHQIIEYKGLQLSTNPPIQG